jgi:hypothetical protein
LGDKNCFFEAMEKHPPVKLADHDHTAQCEFPIEIAEPPQIPSRDFLPWRFSDAESHPTTQHRRANGV